MKDWKDISLSDYYKIKELVSEADEYTTFNLLDMLYDIDSSSMSLSEISRYNGALEFLSKDVPEVTLHKYYTLNGREYDSNFDLTVVTVAQFVDYQNYIKDSRFEDLLSVFFVPKGHKYNDGYDIGEVKKDLLSLDFATVHTIAFFFNKQLELFLATFQFSLIQMIQKMNLPKEKKEELINQINSQDFSNLASYPTSLATRRKQILQLRKLLKNPVASFSTLSVS